MVRPGAPYSANLDAYRALNQATWRISGALPYTSTRTGITVLPARPRRPYARSTHARGYLTHVVNRLVVAWRNGAICGYKVIYRCGGHSNHVELLHTSSLPLCPLCTIEWPGREKGNLT